MEYGRKFATLLGALLLALPASLADAQTTRVETGATVRIEAHGQCRRVENNNGAALMVPHSTPNEWVSGGNSFLQGVPGGVNVSACEQTAAVQPPVCYFNWAMLGYQTQAHCGGRDLSYTVRSYSPHITEWSPFPENPDIHIHLNQFSNHIQIFPRSGIFPTNMTNANCADVLGRPSTQFSSSDTSTFYRDQWPNILRVHRCNTPGAENLMNDMEARLEILNSVCNYSSGINTIYLVSSAFNGAQTVNSHGMLYICE